MSELGVSIDMYAEIIELLRLHGEWAYKRIVGHHCKTCGGKMDDGHKPTCRLGELMKLKAAFESTKNDNSEVAILKDVADRKLNDLKFAKHKFSEIRKQLDQARVDMTDKESELQSARDLLNAAGG